MDRARSIDSRFVGRVKRSRSQASSYAFWRHGSAMRQALLIEDDVTIAALMIELLRGLDFEIRHVARRDQAMALAREARPDVIVTDLLAIGGPTEAWRNVEQL